MFERDRSAALREAVRQALADGVPLLVSGGGTRLDRIRRPDGARSLELSDHRGIVTYRPSELVVTARAGTRLSDLDRALAAEGQALPVEPLAAGSASTLGGLVATGLCGPARPFRGAVRDAVLGVTVLDGHGEIGRFGGQVIKNVAGYDVSRLQTGAWGTLGVLLEVSLRVRARDERTATRVLDVARDDAIERMLALAGSPLPLTGLAWLEGRLHVRVAGSAAGVAAAEAIIGGEAADAAAEVWRGLTDLDLPFFAADPLWRLIVPPAAPQPDLPGNWLLSWGGGERWCVTDAAPERVVEAAAALGGHAERWAPEPLRSAPPAALLPLHRAVKRVFDPRGLINPGVLFAEG